MDPSGGLGCYHRKAKSWYVYRALSPTPPGPPIGMISDKAFNETVA